MNDIVWVIYLMVYIAIILYFVVLGCFMLAHRGNPTSTHGELVAKFRLTRTLSVTMFIWALGLFVYLPPMFFKCPSDHPIYKVLFLVMPMLLMPSIYIVMFAIVQRKVNELIWACSLGLPFLVLAVWQMIIPLSDIPAYIGAALFLVSCVSLLVGFSREHSLYIRRIQSEYSETTSRDILWSWVCFSGFAIQGIIFVIYSLLWSPLLEIVYILLLVFIATCLCYCTCRQRTLDLDVVPEAEPAAEMENKQKSHDLYVVIEERLKSCCEEKLLFLDPNITLETLSLRLAINRTYLGMYFRSRGLSFYQYINTLRVEYAYHQMQDSPLLSIHKVCEMSGFRSQTTFRKAFQEVMGCLPSEVRTLKN